MNREVALSGAQVYPLAGDVTSTAGNATVTVTGLQNTPIAVMTLDTGAVLVYNINSNSWEPVSRACVFVNGLPISDDFLMYVNAPQVYVNGSPVD